MKRGIVICLLGGLLAVTSYGQTRFEKIESVPEKELAKLGVPEKNYSDANIYGHVINAKTGEHVPYINILVRGTNQGAAADETGHYLLVNLPEGEHIIRAQSIGFKSKEVKVTMKKGITKEVNFVLEPDFINTEGIVVTANRNEISRKDATNVVNVLDGKMLQKTQSINIAEGLNFQPGLRVENNCQNCGFTQLRMNGMEGPYTQLLIDGHPVMSALSGVYGLEHIPSEMIDRVEVIRGGGSVLYGANAIAGTVNIITKEAVKNSFEAAATRGIIADGISDNVLSFNSSITSDDYNTGMYLFAQHRNRDPFNANPDELWDADGNGVAETKDDFSELSEMNSTSFGMRAFHRFNQRNKFSLEYHHLGEYRRGGNKFDLQPHFSDITEQARSIVNGGSFTYDWLSGDLKHEVSVYNSLQMVDRETYYGAEQDPNAYGVTEELTNVAGGQYTGHLDNLFFAKATLLGGVEYRYSDLDDKKQLTNQTLPITRQEINNLGAFLEAEWDFDGLQLRTGLRADKHSLMDEVIVNPRVNLLIDINAASQLRMTYSNGFRAPQVFDEDLHIEVAGAQAVRTVNDEDLGAERSASYSLSLDNSGSVGAWQSYFLAEAFYTNLSDQFVKEIQINDNGDAVLYRSNGNGAEVYGINIEGKLAPSDDTDLSIGWTLQRSRNKQAETLWESEDGEQTVATRNILRTPDNYGYFVWNFRSEKSWGFTFNGTFTGEMKVPHLVNPDTEYTVIEKTPVFFDAGLRVHYRMPVKKGNVELFGGVKNMFDHYQSDFDAGINRDAGYIYGPAMPRLFYLGVKLKG